MHITFIILSFLEICLLGDVVLEGCESYTKVNIYNFSRILRFVHVTINLAG